METLIAIQSVSSYWFSHSVSFQHDLCPLSTELSKLQTTSVMSWLLTKNVDFFKGDVMGLCFVFKKSSLVNICLTEMYVFFALESACLICNFELPCLWL